MVHQARTVIIAASALLALVSFWKRNDLPASVSFRSELAGAPRQVGTDEPAFAVDYAGVSYAVQPQFGYELYGMIVSYRLHDGESRMHRLANDHLNVADLCVVWGDTAFSPTLREVDFWNGIFTCNFQTRSAEAWARFKTNEISNNHLLSADSAIRDRVASVRIGDQIRVRGWLASYGSGAAKRGTSTTRDDTGDGACETIFIREFEVLEPAHAGWRLSLYLSVAVLAIAVLSHFRAPYRPYR